MIGGFIETAQDGMFSPYPAMAFLDIGEPVTLAMVIVAVALLVVIILLLPYFTLLRSIADFSYPNAMFKAVGLPFLSRRNLEALSETTSLTELVSRLGEMDIRIASTQRMGLDDVESSLEAENIRSLRNTLASVPEGAKPFYRAYLTRMDALQLKKALRGLRSGTVPVLHPAFYVDAETVRRLSEASSPRDILDIMDGTPFAPALSSAMQEMPDSPVRWEMALDNAVMGWIHDSIFQVDQELQMPLREFHGRMADCSNIILLARWKASLEIDDVSSLLVPGGRELPGWALERLAESPDLQSLISELETTSYGRSLKSLSAGKTLASDVENAMEEQLLDLVTEISSRNNLLVGPSIMFTYGKEKEIANIRAVSRNVEEGGSFRDVEEFLVMGAST